MLKASILASSAIIAKILIILGGCGDIGTVLWGLTSPGRGIKAWPWNSFSWAGDGWEETPWGKGLSSKPWISELIPNSARCQERFSQSNIKVPFNFNTFDIYGYLCPGILHSGHVWREGKQEHVQTQCSVTSKCARMGNEMWSCWWHQSSGSWDIISPFTGSHAGLVSPPKSGIPLDFPEDPNIFSHPGCPLGWSKWLCIRNQGLDLFFLLFLWPGTIPSTLQNGIVTLSYLGLNCFKMELDFGELLAAEGGSSYEKYSVVWLYEWSQLPEELHPWNGAGEQSRIKAGIKSPPRQFYHKARRAEKSPWADFSCQKFQNAHGKPFIRTKKETRQLIFQWLLRQGRSEKECIGDFIFWTGNLKAEGIWEQSLAQEWLSGFLAPCSPSAVPGRWGVESWNPGLEADPSW